MAGIIDFTNALFDSVNATSSIINNYTTNQAKLSTDVKQSRLQGEINSELARIKQDTHYENWNDEINTFFDNIKNNMSNKDSPYYCQNNLQAEMFTQILDQSLVSVSNHVNDMVISEQQAEARVNINNGILNYKNQGYAGQELYDKAKQLIDGGWNIKAYTREQYNQMLDQAFYDSYGSMYEQMFDKTWEEAINRGDSWDTVKSMMIESAPKMMKTDGDNMPVAFDKETYDTKIFEGLERKFKAKQQDLWNQTEKNFANFYDNMLDQRTAEGYNSIAAQARYYIDSIKNTGRASPEQITKWTKVFQLVDDVTLNKKLSGSSGSGKPDDKYEDLFKNNGDTAVDLWEKGLRGNMYDITGLMGEAFAREWWNPIYKENYDKTEQELESTFKLKYEGKTSQNSIVDAVYNKFIEKFPEIKDLVDVNFKKLRDDMNKHPDQYGTKDVEKMGYFLLDSIYSASPNTKSEDILKQFEQYKNDCYLSRVKYIELDKNGNLTKTFNASKPEDIAKAARLAMNKDYVYTWQGKEYWADGKKEALEAKGGIVNVLESAVIGAADIPQSDVDAGKVGFKYKQTKDDMTSQPIITYGGHEFEVIPTDDDKGFKVFEYSVDENGERQMIRELDGKIGGKTKEERTQAKAEAKQTVNDTHGNTAAIESKRAEETNAKISQAKEMPKAMKAAGKVRDIEWDTPSGDTSKRQIYLQDTISAMDADAAKVKNTLENPKTKKKKQMLPSEFEKEYGIDYYTWINNSEITYRMNLILDSK